MYGSIEKSWRHKAGGERNQSLTRPATADDSAVSVHPLPWRPSQNSTGREYRIDRGDCREGQSPRRPPGSAFTLSLENLSS